MGGSRTSLWLLWALFVAVLALEPLLAELVGGRAQPWYAGQTAVAGFVLALIAIALGVWTFALHEALAQRELHIGPLDPDTREGFARLRQRLFALWLLCLLIGLLGSALAWGSASPVLSWPYVAGAAVLLVIHAPRGKLLSGPLG